MHFKAEFKELPLEKHLYIDMYKSDAVTRLGNLIEDSFGWQNPINGNTLHYKLEIEAFPMEKWVEFKEYLLKYFNDDVGSRTAMLTAFERLELFGTNK